MKLVKIANIHKYVGCRVARNVYIGDKMLYLNTGTVLTEKSVKVLQEKKDKLPFTYIYVHTPDSEGIENEIISDELKFKTKDVIEKTLKNIATINYEELKEIIFNILQELYKNPDVIQGISSLLYANRRDCIVHSLNVTVLASVLAIKVGLPKNKVEQVAIGAALHDVGMAKIDVNKVPHSSTSKEDILIIQKHPELGYNIVDNYAISTISRRIILMHHIWEDYEASYDEETGVYRSYPSKINGRTIDPQNKDLPIRIVQVADVFESMINGESTMTKSQVLEYIRSMEIVQFGEGARVMLKYISPYDVGTEVILNTGERAIVKQQSPIPERPVIRLISGSRRGQTLQLTDKDNLTLQILNEV